MLSTTLPYLFHEIICTIATFERLSVNPSQLVYNLCFRFRSGSGRCDREKRSAMKQAWKKTARSQSLAGRSSKNTAPEIHLRRALYAVGLRFRLHCRIPGTRLSVDVVLPKYRLAIFCDGCFWHHHDCRKSRRLWPAGKNKEAWRKKFSDVKARERRAEEALAVEGFIIRRYWECHILQDVERVVTEVLGLTHSDLTKRRS